ncbi:response regulator transcription factor [Anaeromyxobacter oryzae]|uniref:Response regulatory domain-containing protein n=1 Tax=Anaeromyxobacter oryzae TaxID=2918170 RepID=A0ABM7WUK1_9BACT|nr:response regulator [Anaeromyxobacter oryzae]BDG03174.1 hypothetical protein AMOR_21700 [Anaeromyxobacter oryzae]
MVRLLVVDDEEDIREAVAEVLHREGFVVETARDGEQALEKATAARVYSAILLDLMMPRMDGWQFRERQRADPTIAGIPVIIVSATVPDRIDADAVLPKPFDAEDLVRTVRSVVAARAAPVA